jgi:hypothetical protein
MPSLSHEGSDIATWLGDLAPGLRSAVGPDTVAGQRRHHTGFAIYPPAFRRRHPSRSSVGEADATTWPMAPSSPPWRTSRNGPGVRPALAAQLWLVQQLSSASPHNCGLYSSSPRPRRTTVACVRRHIGPAAQLWLVQGGTSAPAYKQGLCGYASGRRCVHRHMPTLVRTHAKP